VDPALDSLLGLAGKGALVVGGGQGIGRSAARMLARGGCDVAVADLVRERAEAVAGEIRALGRKAEPLACDATLAREAEAAVAAASAALGRLDAVVDVVGQASWSPLLELDEATWDRDQALNLKQHFLVGRAAAREMVRQGRGGSLVVVASVSGLFAAPRHGAYGAAKAGLLALVKTMAEEWAEHGIRANAVAPGSVRTPRILAQQAAGAVPAAGILARMAECDDVAGAILFLSSALARRVTGQALVVDGGSAVRSPFAFD
jgi:2-deoxy-D-gluconate 3-dehydrogenase